MQADDKQRDDCYHPAISVAVSAVTSRSSWRSRGGSGKSSSPGVSSPMPEPLRQLRLTLGPPPGERLDKALAAAVPEGLALSRSRLQALILEGAVADRGRHGARGPAAPAGAGHRGRGQPARADAGRAAPEPIPLDVVHEDADLIVIDKPAGLVVHPAPGAPAGTLVNALLHHCGGTLSGIGGRLRPGIVHRIDKDTSGLLVVAKSDAAHRGLAAQFAAHDLERRYLAVVRGAPDPAEPRLAASRRHLLGAGRGAPDRGPHRPPPRRPQAHGGAFRRRQVGGDPRPGARAVRTRGRTGRGARRVPARDRAHPPDPGAHGLRRPPARRRHASTAAGAGRDRSTASRGRRCTPRPSASGIR